MLFRLLLVACCLVDYTVSWSFIGHEMIAAIASKHLTETASLGVSEILGDLSLSDIAPWADSIKWQAQYRFTSRLHYINSADDEEDRPPDRCASRVFRKWQKPGGQELVAAIYNYTSILRHADDGTWRANEALRFLVHFIEDLHQPLHLSGRARGGNDIMVRFDGYHTNLHRIWDGLGLLKRMRKVSAERRGNLKFAKMVTTADVIGHGHNLHEESSVEELKDDYETYINELLHSEQYAPLIRGWLMCPERSADSKFGCPEVWATDISPLNCEYTWKDVVEEESLHPEYWRRIEEDKIFELLVMKAAMRLAAVLNAVFEERAITA